MRGVQGRQGKPTNHIGRGVRARGVRAHGSVARFSTCCDLNTTPQVAGYTKRMQCLEQSNSSTRFLETGKPALRLTLRDTSVSVVVWRTRGGRFRCDFSFACTPTRAFPCSLAPLTTDAVEASMWSHVGFRGRASKPARAQAVVRVMTRLE